MASVSTIVSHLQGLLLCNIKSFADNTRVNAFRNVSIGLLEQFSDQEYDRSRAVTTLFVLRYCCSGNHRSSWVLKADGQVM
jgi:hypothetical protein